jgi:hypothetical protein
MTNPLPPSRAAEATTATDSREAKGRFPSTRCHCHFAEPYGFVPEADCPEHDTPQFAEFLSYVIHWNETHD